jgi:nucleotidyltransferase/DNA polymerase involved in DNA repair
VQEIREQGQARSEPEAKLLGNVFTQTGLLSPDQSSDALFSRHNRELSALKAASVLAWAARDRLRSALQYTCSAGIAFGPTLAKMVGAMQKPDCQSTLLPSAAAALVASLPLRKIPGCGRSACKKLLEVRPLSSHTQSPPQIAFPLYLHAHLAFYFFFLDLFLPQAGVTSVSDMAGMSLPRLRQLVGPQCGDLLFGLLEGRDPGRVVPSGPPQSLSEEDIFYASRSPDAVRMRLAAMATSLLRRIAADHVRHHRSPRTLKVAVRPSTAPYARGPSTRQGSLPPSILAPILQAAPSAVISSGVEVASSAAGLTSEASHEQQLLDQAIADCSSALVRLVEEHLRAFDMRIGVINIGVCAFAPAPVLRKRPFVALDAAEAWDVDLDDAGASAGLGDGDGSTCSMCGTHVLEWAVEAHLLFHQEHK